MTESGDAGMRSRESDYDTATAYANLYQQLEDQLFPPRHRARSLSAAMRGIFAIALGTLSASISVLAIFIILNLLFNFQPS